MELIDDRETRKQALIRRIENGEEVLSYSSLSAFAESPKHFIQYKLREREQTPAMLMGVLIHCLVLEPKEFENRYLVVDDTLKIAEIGGAKPRSTKVYKQWLAERTADAGERVVIPFEMVKEAKWLALSVTDNYPAFKKIEKCTKKEHGIEWEFMNFNFRGYIDGTDEETIIVDLKKMVDASEREAHRTIVKMDYYLQAAMYETGLGRGDKPYYIIALDNSGGVSVHLLEQQLIEEGHKKYKLLMEKFNSCILLNAWDKSYDFYSRRFDGIYVCEKPSYMY